MNPPDPNSPWNPSNDPMDVFGKNRAGAWPITPLNPSQPFPGPSPSPMIYWGPGLSLGQAALAVCRSLGGLFPVNVIALGVLWPVWVCLYPLAAVTGAFTFYYAYPFLLRFVPRSVLAGENLPVLVVGFAAAAVVLWNVSRFEHVLAANQGFRLARHVVRLPLFGLLAILAIERYHGVRYNLSWPLVSRVLSIPQYLAIVIGTMVAAHFILWNWAWAREFWHRRLMIARLRKPAMGA